MSRNHPVISRLFAIILVGTLLIASSVDTFARKKSYRFKVTSEKSINNHKSDKGTFISESRPDSAYLQSIFPSSVIRFMTSGISSENTDSMETLHSEIVFTGFDKKRNNSKESFFIINNSPEDITGAVVEITYHTIDGRMLHKRYATLSVTVPSGETRKIDLPSWDTQHSFYYLKSENDLSRGNPFDVTISPIAYITQN